MLRLRNDITNRTTEGLDGLRSSLQSAIELEHATIPPYLYALYSIRPGSNQRLAEIIRSVVLEEMLHFALGCNLLNAIGGEPSLDRPDFMPTYPGPLPGAVAEVEVSLAPLSKDLLHDTFMEIEEPEDPLEFPVISARSLEAADPEPLTIGQFYQGIKNQFVELSTHSDIFTGAPNEQLGFGLPGLIRVTDLQSAKDAIDLIVEQGEGAPLSPLNPADAPAHYYLFAAAYHGRELVPQEGIPPFAYAGDPIPFDADGIAPLETNPTLKRYEGTAAMGLNQQFNATYTKMLKVLQRSFNGNPASIFEARTLMGQLRGEALALAEIEFEPGVFAGPTYTYDTSIE